MRMAVDDVEIETKVGKPDASAGPLLRRWGAFMLIGAVLYLCLYAWSEYLVYAYGQKNRFFMIGAAPPQHFDFVLLGASHAMPLDFEDMNERLQSASGSTIINLSSEGAGILPNRLMLEYFLTRHTASHVVFVLDSFAFYSPQWNEDRLDAGMLRRAPLDLALARTLWSHSWSRWLLPVYVSGFGKINNQDRFAPDVPEAESGFGRTYRPIAQIDRRRIQYLYPSEPDPTTFAQYAEEFKSLVELVRDNGMEIIAVKPPTPARYRDKLPKEEEFDATMSALLSMLDIPYHDFSQAVTEDAFFYDTDHLNRDGVVQFIDNYFGDLLRTYR